MQKACQRIVDRLLKTSFYLSLAEKNFLALKPSTSQTSETS
jgi:hypothetical protein